ncbi:MAG: ClbS/DfsB family four-helix bundle protein [Pseudomonadota bacterium]
MPAATTKTALLTTLEAEWDKLEKVIANVPEDLAFAPDETGTTIKDIIGHRAAWIDLFLGWLQQSEAGAPVDMPAKGFKWTMLPELNAQIRQEQANLDWPAAVVVSQDRKAALVTALDARDDKALYGAPMAGGNGTWTIGRYGESAGPSHFRSAAKYIRARLKASGV